MKKVIITLVILFLSILLISCSKTSYTYFPPTEEFYINDRANALLSYAKYNIYINGKHLYETIEKDDDIESNLKGAQIVVLTLNNDQNEIDTTTLFNEWGIGKNDMGILIVLYFENDNFDSITIELGTNMMGYLSAFETNQMITDHFYDETWQNDYEIGLLVLYHELIGYVYTKVYDYTSYTYNSDLFIENQFIAAPKLQSDENKYNLFNLPWYWYLILLLIVPSGLAGIFGFIGIKFGNNKGGGGSSVGYWFNRRK